MFIKRCTRNKNGKPHTYWQLVESYRTARGPRHRTVAYLGELSACKKHGWARLAAQLDSKAASKAQQQLLLFERLSEPDDTEPVPDQVEVNLDSVRVRNTSDFGDVYLALILWRTLGLDEFFQGQGLDSARQDVPWALMACILTIARLVEPDSELHVEDTWYRRTALADMLGVGADKVNDSRLYRTLDVVLPLKDKIQMHLKQRIGELFAPDFDLLLYDLTSTYFEGQCKANPQARYGYSRDHRPDCKQVCIALVATRDGFPLGYEVFDGNRGDVTIVEEIVQWMQSKYGRARRVWVMDRGLVSESNLGFIRGQGGYYLVGTPRSMLKRFEKQLLEGDWSQVCEGIEVQLVDSPDGKETFILCRSVDRRQKEKAIHERFVQHIESGLTRLAQELAKSCKRRDRGVIERRIGRLLGSNTRAAGAFKIKLIDDTISAAGLRLRWCRIEAWTRWVELSEGCYLLRTNLTGRSAQEIWQTYMQLMDVEAVFRTGKSDLRIRPIWHQLQHRVQGHILFSFLAYALWKALQIWMERAGLGRGVRTVLEELARLKSTDVVLGTSCGRQIKLCCVTDPDAAQRALLDRLGLVMPERLGRPRWVRRPENMMEM
jgi:transposase